MLQWHPRDSVLKNHGRIDRAGAKLLHQTYLIALFIIPLPAVTEDRIAVSGKAQHNNDKLQFVISLMQQHGEDRGQPDDSDNGISRDQRWLQNPGYDHNNDRHQCETQAGQQLHRLTWQRSKDVFRHRFASQHDAHNSGHAAKQYLPRRKHVIQELQAVRNCRR